MNVKLRNLFYCILPSTYKQAFSALGLCLLGSDHKVKIP